MALITCKECGNAVSDSAKTCPKCGVRVRSGGKVWKWLLIVPIGVFVIFAIIGMNDPAIQAMEKDRTVINMCMEDLKSPLTPAGGRDLVRSTCAKLKDEFMTKYGRQP